MTFATAVADPEAADSPTPAASGRGWTWVFPPAGIAAASRAVSIALILAANHLNKRPNANPFAAWDAVWYLGISHTGYHAHAVRATATSVYHDFAFFPLWPGAIRLFSPGNADNKVVAVVLANVLFVLATVVIWRVFANRFGRGTATRGVALLAFSPAAYVLSMAYSEPLLLLVVGLGFLVPRRSVFRLPLAALAVATRIAGTAVVVSAAFDVLVQRGRARWVSLLTALAGTAAFAAWWVFIAVLTHDPLGFLHGSPLWARLTGLPGLIHDLEAPTPQRFAWIAVVLVVFAGGVRLLRRDSELGVYSMAAIAMALLPGSLIESTPRYALAAFPAFAGLALGLGRKGTLLLIAAGVALQWWFATLVFVGQGVPP